MDTGFIKIARKIFDWEWWGDPVTLEVFIWCILKANWKDGRFKGQTIPRGSFVTSRARGAAECRLSQQTWRSAINRLISTSELTTKSTNKYTVITVVNYEVYQTEAENLTSNLTTNSTNDQPTTNHNRRNKEIKNKENNISASETEKEAESLFEELWNLYPRKKGKGSISKSKKLELFKVGRENMLMALEMFIADMQGREEKYIPYGSTFFNSGYKDYVEKISAKVIKGPEPVEDSEEEEMTDEEFFALVDSNFGEVG